jgi:hypothetical protein
MTKLSDIWEGDFKAGDLVRWNLADSWCEGCVTATLDAMTVITAYNWPAAYDALRAGLHVYPRLGTVRLVTKAANRGCGRCAAGNPGGGSCTGCGYPRAYAHPDCVSDAFDMDVVYVGGTAMLVTGSTGVPFGTVSVMLRDGSFQSHQIPLKAGDYVRWDNPLYPAGQVWIEGELLLNPLETARIQIGDFRGEDGWYRGRRLDVCAEPGTLRRIPRPGVKRHSEPMRDGMVKERYTEPDPLDVVYDGYTLRDLLGWDALYRQGDELPVRRWFTARHRAAISAHWSAELRAKVRDSQERERRRVLVDLQDID